MVPSQNSAQNKPGPLRPAQEVLAIVLKGSAPECEKRFTDTFLVGRSQECDLRISEDCVSRSHLQVAFDGERWWLTDLASANGTFINGERIRKVPLPDRAEIELGKGGALLSLVIEKQELPKVEDAPASPGRIHLGNSDHPALSGWIA